MFNEGLHPNRSLPRQVFAVSLPAAVATAVREMAENDDRTISYVLRELIARGLTSNGVAANDAVAKTPSGVARGASSA